MSTFANPTAMASYLLLLASMVVLASAQRATTNALGDIPESYHDSLMKLSLSPPEAPPVPYEYSVAPLTLEAGQNSSNANAIRQINVRGNMVIVDQSNYNNLSLEDAIAYMSCDSNVEDSYISPSDMLNDLMAANPSPQAILLYTTVGACCSLEGSDFTFNSIWTTIDKMAAGSAKNMTSDSTGTVLATITGNSTDDSDGNASSQGGNNSAVAMSILYSITGLITLLFLVIIATGAIRAHRHPERYGPRAGHGGRPRQSRAKGIARAVLETLPIVKFGDPHPGKPDPEAEFDTISAHRADTASPVPDAKAPSITLRPASPAEAETSQVLSSTVVGTSNAVARKESVSEDEPATAEHLGCSICTEDFNVGEDVRVLPCDHKFHPNCVDPWLVNVSGTCPLCRLDLRPQRSAEGEGSNTESHQEPPPVPEADIIDVDGAHRRRRSRLLDWNGLRHASVDERIQALRQFRQSQQMVTSAENSPEEQTRRARLTTRLRERFHVRTQSTSSPIIPHN
ncbi:hypothetical protein F4778DRAFT_461952 [Xylariomycetidae sp. FL2044]|nr:hypothetical protein F4778DRAFT_461952 [Xylariomycetidae sp. FL2044]